MVGAAGFEPVTPADISAAQKLASQCIAKKYKGC